MSRRIKALVVWEFKKDSDHMYIWQLEKLEQLHDSNQDCDQGC